MNLQKRTCQRNLWKSTLMPPITSLVPACCKMAALWLIILANSRQSNTTILLLKRSCLQSLRPTKNKQSQRIRKQIIIANAAKVYPKSTNFFQSIISNLKCFSPINQSITGMTKSGTSQAKRQVRLAKWSLATKRVLSRLGQANQPPWDNFFSSLIISILPLYDMTNYSSSHSVASQSEHQVMKTKSLYKSDQSRSPGWRLSSGGRRWVTA